MGNSLNDPTFSDLLIHGLDQVGQGTLESSQAKHAMERDEASRKGQLGLLERQRGIQQEEERRLVDPGIWSAVDALRQAAQSGKEVPEGARDAPLIPRGQPDQASDFVRSNVADSSVGSLYGPPQGTARVQTPFLPQPAEGSMQTQGPQAPQDSHARMASLARMMAGRPLTRQALNDIQNVAATVDKLESSGVLSMAQREHMKTFTAAFETTLQAQKDKAAVDRLQMTIDADWRRAQLAARTHLQAAREGRDVRENVEKARLFLSHMNNLETSIGRELSSLPGADPTNKGMKIQIGRQLEEMSQVRLQYQAAMDQIDTGRKAPRGQAPQEQGLQEVPSNGQVQFEEEPSAAKVEVGMPTVRKVSKGAPAAAPAASKGASRLKALYGK